MNLSKIIYILIIPLFVTACSKQDISWTQNISSTQNISTSQIKNNIDTLLTSPKLKGAQLAIMVRDANSGAIIYQHNANSRLITASSMKLFTSAAAFDILGAEYKFLTSTLTDGTRHKEKLRGNLYLRGSGDPTMLFEDYQALAAGIAAKGIRRVSGDLIIDDTWFDNIRLGNDWAQDDEEHYYAAQISALTVSADKDYDAGSIMIKLVASDTVNQPLTVSMIPANNYVTLVNKAKTTRAGGDDTLIIKREHGSNRIIISGNLPVGKEKSVLRSVWEPTQLVANLFKQALRQNGIKIEGKTRIGVATPLHAQELSKHVSIPLSELAIPFLKLSNNTHAEILLKTIGRKVFNSGTSQDGIKAIADFSRRNNIDTSSMLQTDGSGLSRRNLVTTKLFTDLLIATRKQPWFDQWYAALPVAGDPNKLVGGTLRKRMRGTAAEGNVVAKTGSLSAVSSLTGYVKTANHGKLVFSILSNNALISVKELEDSIVVLLANLTQSSY